MSVEYEYDTRSPFHSLISSVSLKIAELFADIFAKFRKFLKHRRILLNLGEFSGFCKIQNFAEISEKANLFDGENRR